MSLISAPVLLQVPKKFTPEWRRVFGTLVSPVHVIRSVFEVGRSPQGLWLSLNQLHTFRTAASIVDNNVLRVLDELDGVAQKSWFAGRDLRDHAQVALGQLGDLQLLDRMANASRRESLVSTIRRELFKGVTQFDQLSPLKKLRKAMTADRAIKITYVADDDLGITPSFLRSIDTLIEFVLECAEKHGGTPRKEMARFHELDTAVIVPAYATGVCCLVPNQTGLTFCREPGEPEPSEFLGATCLPGEYKGDLFVIASKHWLQGMAVLRKYVAENVHAAEREASPIATLASSPADQEHSPADVAKSPSADKRMTKSIRRMRNADRDEWIRSQTGSDAQIERRLKAKIASDCSDWKPVKANRIGQIRTQRSQSPTIL
ncbi:MAG TPA: hypothetical protein VFE62_25760 [Gemmataceae bacterium]|nr:hypothetical protein [Gemmataceae bacterium]